MSVLEKIRSGEYTTKEASGLSNVWVCFKKIVKTTNGSEEVQPFVICAKCEHVFKYSKGASPSNLRKHRCFKEMCEPENGTSTSTDDDVSNRKRERIDVNDSIKQDIMDKCVRYATQDLRSFAAINGSGFKELARCLVETGVKLGTKNFDINDILPRPNTISHNLHKMHNTELERFVSELQPLLEKGCCAATTDMWMETKKQRKFMALIVHYLDSNWRLYSRVLCTIQLPNVDQEQTDTTILRALKEKIKSLHLQENALKKLTYTTDQGSYIQKALEKYSRINCTAHILNLILTHTFEITLLQEVAPRILELFTSCKSLVEYLKRSGNSLKLDTTVRKECTSRWNTKFDMLLSIQKHFQTIKEILETAKEQHRLRGIEKYLLDRLIIFLQPFKAATLLFAGDRKPTIHLVLLHMHILKEKLIKLYNEETCIEVQTIIRHCLNNVFDIQFQPHRIHKLAAFLWPEYKQLRFLDNNTRDEIYAIVKDLLSCPLATSPTSSITLSSSSDFQEIDLHGNTSDCSDTQDDEQFSNKYKDVYIDNDKIWQSQVTGELELYKGSRASDRNILRWWRSHENNYPLLHQLARRILCIPASCSSSERAFSSANRELEERRSNLKGENVDALLFLHSAGKD